MIDYKMILKDPYSCEEDKITDQMLPLEKIPFRGETILGISEYDLTCWLESNNYNIYGEEAEGKSLEELEEEEIEAIVDYAIVHEVAESLGFDIFILDEYCENDADSFDNFVFDGQFINKDEHSCLSEYLGNEITFIKKSN